MIRDFAGLVGVFKGREFVGKGAVFRPKNGEVESLEVKFEQNVSDIVKEGHGHLALDRMKLAASRAAAGRAC